MVIKDPIVTEHQKSPVADSGQYVPRDKGEIKEKNQDANRPGEITRMERALGDSEVNYRPFFEAA
jgi:hypothetical protein